MNTMDRIVRIIYREMDLREYVNLHDKSTSEIITKIQQSFKTSDENVKKRIKRGYLEIYDENYNPDELDIMLSWIEKKLYNYGYDNFLGIFIYISNKLIDCVNDELRINFFQYLEWHGFINKVDYNIFYSSFIASNNMRLHKHKIGILHDNKSIYNRLKPGVAENHMHIKGSGYTTDMSWYELMREIPYQNKTFLNFLSSKYKNCPEHILAFQKIKIIRTYLYDLINTDKLSEKRFSCKDMLSFLKADSIEKIEILCKKKDEDNISFENLFFYNCENFNINVEKIYGKTKKYIISERIFLEKLFQLYISEKLTAFQKYLFNVYILGLNKIKFEFIQDNSEMGFENFKKKENIKESVIDTKGYDNADIYLTVFDNYYNEKFIKYIEFRIAPKNSVKKYIDTIKQIERANDKIYKEHKKYNKNIKKIEYGLIIHYIKCKEEFNDKSGFRRKEKSIEEIKRYQLVIDKLLELRDSEILKLNYRIAENEEDDILKLDNHNISFYKEKIVGIDTANYELNFRPENFGEVYRKHRSVDSKNINLNFTYHVGEDFNTIANGLRAIDEVIEFLGFRRGDRLGHAIALGLDVDTYFYRKREKISSTIEDYVDDTAWMYQMISDYDKNNAYILRFLEDEFSKYKNIYLGGTKFQDIDINEYLDAYNLRGDDPSIYMETLSNDNIFNNDLDNNYIKLCNKYKYKINKNNIRHKESFYNKTARELYFHYQYNGRLKKNSRKILMFDIDNRYKEAVKLCQKLLKKKVYELELKIETNPSSNKKISSINKFIELPLLNFNQYNLSDKTTEYDIPISINTDDSAIFQTNLISEYSYIAAALIREGYNREEIYDYIEYLRKLSLEHSFVNKY